MCHVRIEIAGDEISIPLVSRQVPCPVAVANGENRQNKTVSRLEIGPFGGEFDEYVCVCVRAKEIYILCIRSWNFEPLWICSLYSGK